MDLIAHIIEVHGLATGDTLMIGDRAQDIAGARANGIASLGALWGYGSRAELEKAGATALCENPAMLCDTAFATLKSR